MAIGTGISLSELERSWFSQRVSGVSSTTPLNEIKRKYYMEQIGTASLDIRFLDDLEMQWLRKAITDGGGTPVGQHMSGLWKQLVAVNSLRVSNSLDENKQTYYRNIV